MLSDQAEKLRRLVSQSLPEDRGSQCRLTVLSGCKGGVGTTTISLNLAVALQRIGSRVLLVDCSPFRGDLAQICRLPNEYDLDDVLQSRCAIRQAISPGPGGIHVLPRLGITNALSPPNCWQVLRHLENIRQDFDQIVFDAGCCTAAAESLWSTADQIIVVTTTDQVAIANAYGLVKGMVNRKVPTKRVGFAVNCHENEQDAFDLLDRLIRSCEQFLALQAEPYGCIPVDALWPVAANEARSIACAHAGAPSAVAVHEIAQRLASGAETDSDLNSAMVS